MKLLLTSIILFSVIFCFAQQKRMNVYFLKDDGNYVTAKDSADYIRIVSEPDSGSALYNVAEYYKNGNRKLVGLSSKINPPVFEGQCVTFYKNGKKESFCNYKSGLPVGDAYQFYPNGRLYEQKQFPDNNDRYNEFTSNYLIEAELDSMGNVLVEKGEGHYKSYDRSFKQIVEEGSVRNGKRDSVWTGYYKDIETHFTENYKNGVLIEGKATYRDGTSGSYTNTRSTPPEFKGGVKAFGAYLGRNINYPEEERKENVQGVVIVSFIVEKDGEINDVKVKKTANRNMDNEAVRVISQSPRWKSGTQFGRPVRVVYEVPVNFALTE